MDDDFQKIENVLGDAIFASWLLGYDFATEENDSKIADFAEDDSIAEEAGPLQLRFDVPPEEAIDYFKRKRVIKAKTFYDIQDEARAAAFTVSGIYKEDVLESFRQEIEDALTKGTSQQKIIKNFKNILSGAGHKELGDWHLENVFRTNMQMAYGVGRRRQMEEVSDLLPFWQYSAVNDDRTRPTHRALDGIVLPANHEFWNTHYPPWDFSCRCNVISLPDLPDGYDSEFPNPDTQISYDKKGNPVKAQYRLGTYELSAGKFVGVPKQNAGLQETIENAAKKSRKKRDDDDDDVVEKRLERRVRRETKRRQPKERENYETPSTIIEKAKELQRQNSKVEVAHIFDRQGRLLGTAIGDAGSVEMSEELAEAGRGGIDLHWHPPEGSRSYESFSVRDIFNAIDFDILETLLVTRNYFFSMRQPKNGWSEDVAEKIIDAYNKHHARIQREMHDRVRDGELSLNDAKDLERHLIWQAVAKEVGLRYKRKKL